MTKLPVSFEHAAIDRDREAFILSLLGDLADVLQHNVGLNEAEGFVAMVGNRTGLILNREYRAVVDADRLSIEQVAAALVDLKNRINGGFRIESLSADRIVLVNDRCPFGDDVLDRPAICMITSNVFGRIAADNLSYARVELEETIARRDPGCRVIIHLDSAGPRGEGREYFG